jgi:ArsR family metal-binding transcriptional regulator
VHRQSSRTASDISSATIHRNYTKDGQKITIYTDSKITLDKLQNTKIHTHIIDEIRRKIEMKRTNWEITVCWVKAHA